MTDPSANLDRLAEILEHAMALQGAQRAAYLRAACGADDALRAEVKRTALELKRARVAAMSCTDDSRYLEAHRIVARAE